MNNLDLKNKDITLYLIIGEYTSFQEHPDHLKKFLNVYSFFEKVRGGGQRERETQNLKQAPGSETVGTEPNVGLELTNCETMTRAEVGCLTN